MHSQAFPQRLLFLTSIVYLQILVKIYPIPAITFQMGTVLV